MPSLPEVAAAGDRLATLRALRDALAEQLDLCEAKRDYAALSQRLMDVLAQIEQAERVAPDAKGTALDEVNARRAAKAAKAPGRAAGSGV